jgi:hypothetical protein
MPLEITPAPTVRGPPHARAYQSALALSLRRMSAARSIQQSSPGSCANGLNRATRAYDRGDKAVVNMVYVCANKQLLRRAGLPVPK